MFLRGSAGRAEERCLGSLVEVPGWRGSTGGKLQKNSERGRRSTTKKPSGNPSELLTVEGEMASRKPQ